MSPSEARSEKAVKTPQVFPPVQLEAKASCTWEPLLVSLGWPAKSRLWRARPGKRPFRRKSTAEVEMREGRAGRQRWGKESSGARAAIARCAEDLDLHAPQA